MKKLGFLIVIICGILLTYGTSDFPKWGDPTSPASSYLSPHYIKNTLNDTAVPNIVTAVLADYRGYDTMFETTVIFAAGLACFALLRVFRPRNKSTTTQFYRHKSTNILLKIKSSAELLDASDRFEKRDSQWTPHDVIIKTTCRLVTPFIQLFALYVIAHGHHSPGGGFQGGVILGASFILFAISNDFRATLNRMGERIDAILSSIGVFVYAGTGLACLLLGLAFLDYKALAPILFSDPIMARSHGILIVEIGVGIAVMSVMVWLYYNISSSGEHEEGL